MKIHPRLLATHATGNALGLGSGGKGLGLALLPPIPLYRRLLRAHRKYLPVEMRLLGDQYVKAEFRSHKAVENPVHIVCFFQEMRREGKGLEERRKGGGRGESGANGRR
jgi:hypothetical protein